MYFKFLLGRLAEVVLKFRGVCGLAGEEILPFDDRGHDLLIGARADGLTDMKFKPLFAVRDLDKGHLLARIDGGSGGSTKEVCGGGVEV